jgi:Na+(H+)/acetate symporter ActP
MSAYWKIPLQVLVLMIGVLVFVFYLFNQPPLLFNPVHDARVQREAADRYAGVQSRFEAAYASRRDAALALAATEDATAGAAAETRFLEADAQVRAARKEATTIVQQVTGDRTYRDVNYVFPTFVTTHLPVGLVGIVLAAIMAAAMSSIAAELNALATTTVIDFYRRLLRPEAPDVHYLAVSRIATGFWGIFTCIVALFAADLGSLIEVVNRFGSFFYGSILGVFMLAMLTRRASGTGAFIGLIAGMSLVASVAVLRPDVSFLWHNVIGAVGVVVVGTLVSLAFPGAWRAGDAA